jgi:hypothetical protein
MKRQPQTNPKWKIIGHSAAFLMATLFLTLHASNIWAAQPADGSGKNHGREAIKSSSCMIWTKILFISIIAPSATKGDASAC